VPFVVAGALDIAGRTAWNSVHSFDFGPGDTVFVSAAAGGVGFIASQLVVATGATVVGSAGPDNQEVLRAIGVIPVHYGAGLVDELREVAPGGYTAALDNHGDSSVDAALAVGIPVERINSIAAYHSIASLGLRNVGGGPANPELLATIAAAVASGALRVLIDSTWPLDQVVEAFERLERGHVTGKVVVTID
jgi:NADPH:quinone reductase-like Zn-dependent oxidoreductase